MGNEIILLGAGIISFVILFIVFLQSDRHYILKLMGIFFAVFFLFFVVRGVSQEAYSTCTWTVNETTDTVSVITKDCNTPSPQTALGMTKLFVWWIRLLLIYVFVYFLWDLLGDKMMRLAERFNIIKRRKGGNE